MTPTPTEQALQTLRKARPFVQSYVEKHPKWEYAGQMQDPSGSHALVGELDAAIAALEAAPTGAAQAAGEVPSKPLRKEHFDAAGFSDALDRSAKARSLTMKDVANQTGVSETTLSRMRNEGRHPDAASIAALSAWAGINPANYDSRPRKGGLIVATPPAEPGAEVPMPEPDGFRTRYRSEPGMIGHYPWTYADQGRRRVDRPQHETEDLYSAEALRTYGDSRAERMLGWTPGAIQWAFPGDLAYRIRALVDAAHAAAPPQSAARPPIAQAAQRAELLIQLNGMIDVAERFARHMHKRGDADERDVIQRAIDAARASIEGAAKP